MDSGIECTFSKFDDDTKLCGAVNMLEGRDNIHRDLDRLGLCKLHSSAWSKYKVINLSRGNPKHKDKLSTKYIKSSTTSRSREVILLVYCTLIRGMSPHWTNGFKLKKGRLSFKLKKGRLSLVIGKKFFTVRVVYWKVGLLPWQGAGTRRSLRCLPKQTIQFF